MTVKSRTIVENIETCLANFSPPNMISEKMKKRINCNLPMHFFHFHFQKKTTINAISPPQLQTAQYN